MGPRMIWNDGLDNEREPIHYYHHMYPTLHLDETIEATSNNLEDAGHPPMTQQEWFVLLGIFKAMSFYPKFRATDMFSPTSMEYLPQVTWNIWEY